MAYIKKTALVWALGLLVNCQLFATQPQCRESLQGVDFLVIAQELIKIGDEIGNACLNEIENTTHSYNVDSTDQKTINGIFSAIKEKYNELMPQLTEILKRLPEDQRESVIKRLDRAQEESLKDSSFSTIDSTIKAIKDFFTNMHLALFNTYKNEFFNRMYEAEILYQNVK